MNYQLNGLLKALWGSVAGLLSGAVSIPGTWMAEQCPVPHPTQAPFPAPGAPSWQSTFGFGEQRNNGCWRVALVPTRGGGWAAGAGMPTLPPPPPPPPSLPARLLAPAVLCLGWDRGHQGRDGSTVASRAEEDRWHPDALGRRPWWHQSGQGRQSPAGAPAQPRLEVPGRSGGCGWKVEGAQGLQGLLQNGESAWHLETSPGWAMPSSRAQP